MTMREQERTPQQQNNNPALDRVVDDDRVMLFARWCEVNGFSKATGRRLRNTGQGPGFVQLSPRRIGVTVRANREWQKSRERA